MYDMSKVFKAGREVRREDVCDAYTNLAFERKLPNYKIFTLDSLIGQGRLVRGVDIPEFAYDFVRESGKVLGIANIINNRVEYIVFRSLKDKKFLTAGNNKSIPYGVGYFDPEFTYGDLVVIVEGLKDRDALSGIYPNVIACEGAGLSTLSREIVVSLSNKFLLLFDNPEMDKTGKKAFFKERKKLKELNCQVIEGNHPSGVKDTGEIADALFRSDGYLASYLESYYGLMIENAR